MEIPASSYGQITSRSGLSSKKLLDVTAGVIDSDYRGVVKILLHNHSDQSHTITPGQAIAQILFLPLAPLSIQEVSELSSTSRGQQGFGSTDSRTFVSEVIHLKPVAGRPPGTTFLGAQPSKATVRLNSPTGPTAQVVIDSGSNISLVSTRLLEKLDPSPKLRTGQEIKISQVTGRSATSQYVPLDLYFETKDTIVLITIEAYIVKDMNAPIILGNDFADQYSLSIIRENGTTNLRLGDSDLSIPLDSSVDSSYLEVKALRSEAAKVQHRRNNKRRRRQKGPIRVYASTNMTIAPGSIRKITIKTSRPLTNTGIFIPSKRLPRRIQNSTLIDSILPKNPSFIHATNDLDTLIQVHEGDVLGTLEEDYYDHQPPEDNTPAQNFFNLINPILQARRDEENSSEQEYYNQQSDLPNGPKLAEVPEYEDVPSRELLSSLDFNPKLSPLQKSQLEKVILRNLNAFSLDGRIGSYSDIKYQITLKEDAVPISMPPYHASPDKRRDIDKQIDKWYSQGVIQDSSSPWGAPVIVVYRNGKARVCIDYRKVNMVTMADEYPLPRQSDIL